MRTVNDQRMTSPPEVVAKAIGRAVRSSRPRTRYAVGGGVRTILFVQWILTDRGFDRFIRRALGIPRRQQDGSQNGM
jgi:hypothetical protein